MTEHENEHAQHLASVDAKHRMIEELIEGADPAESKKLLRIMEEFDQGFELLKTVGLAASFFGSARCTAGGSGTCTLDDVLYREVHDLAGRLAKEGFAVVTGGSGGVMQAANHGAKDAGGRSIGFNVKLPNNQPPNEYTTDSLLFRHFFTRKVMLAYASEVYIFFPGGLGTLDELTEMLTLIQTKKVRPVPVVLVGKEFWAPFVAMLHDWLYEKYHTIDEEDLDLFHVVDSADEAHDLIMKLVDVPRLLKEEKEKVAKIGE